MDDYIKFRGRCREMSEEIASQNPDLDVVRGYYYCPIWNTTEPHWWCEDSDGNIVDPTSAQFGSKGRGEYTKFDGFYDCEVCGKKVAEEDMIPVGNYSVCSNECGMRLVGL